MNPVNGYETATAYTGNGESITPGGHVCKIIGAKVEDSQYVQNYPQQLVLALEICEGSSLDGICGRKYEAAKKRNPKTNPLWPCVYKVFIYTQEGVCSGFFKGAVTSIEESNPGYNFSSTWKESLMVGKLVGVVFREEEFIKNDGSIGTTCRPFQIRSVDTVRAGVPIPEIKRLDDKKRRPSQMPMQDVTEEEEDELPF